MSMFTKTYGDAVTLLRGIAHLVGETPFTDEMLYGILQASVGELFIRMAPVQERYWVKNLTLSGLGDVREIDKPDDFYRGIEFYGSSSTATTTPEYTEWREANLKEVEDEVRRESGIDTTDTRSLQMQNLWADAGEKIRLSRAVDDFEGKYVYDPSYQSSVIGGSTVLGVPAHFYMIVVYLTASIIESHANEERGQNHNRRASMLIDKFLDGVIVSEEHSFNRKRSYHRSKEFDQIKIQDY
jgi:hypothetical protein